MVPRTVEIERVIVDFDVEDLFYGLFDRLYPRVTELHNLPRISEDDVVMLSVKIRFFVLGLVFAELMLAHEFAFEQQLYGVVQGGPAHPVILVFHLDIQGFYIAVVIGIVYLLPDGVALRGLPVSVLFEEGREDTFDDVLVLVSHGTRLGCFTLQRYGIKN